MPKSIFSSPLSQISNLDIERICRDIVERISKDNPERINITLDKAGTSLDIQILISSDGEEA